MKIAVISDLHFGYGYGSELEMDSFDNANEAVKTAIAAGADLILMPGDVFDSRFPRTDVLALATRVLVKPMLKKSTGMKLVSCSKKLKPISQRTLRRLPIIAIHGTHERRYGVNTIEALENAGIIIHLNKDTICLEKDCVRLAVHGMSGVPERYAKQTLDEWKPQPIEGCLNILMLHQSIDPFIYSPLEPAMLKIGDLPKGFDLITDGHLHIHGLEKADGAPLLFPGSTVITQFEENEANSNKGFYLIETAGKDRPKIEFVPLKNSRKFFLRELKAGASLRYRIENELEGILSNEFSKLPIVKIKLSGSLREVIEQELKEIEKKYADRMILRIVKALESPELASKIEFIRSVQEQKLSVEEMGLQLLKKNLEELKFEGSFNYEKVFGMLVDGDADNAFKVLTGEQKTLSKILKNG